MSDTTHVHDLLDDYVDGLLPDRETGAVRRHLAGCAPCRDQEERIRALQAAARALPRAIAPPRDLWAGIAARIGAEQPAVMPSRPAIEVEFRRPAAPVWQRRALLAAAAVTLVALSSGVTALVLRPAATGAPAMATLPATAAGTGSVALASFRPAEAEYLRTVESLQQDLAARRDQLAPETVATVEANLRIIDRAIAEARAALVADPANADLPHHLSEIYRQKVELLQQAVELRGTQT